MTDLELQIRRDDFRHWFDTVFTFLFMPLWIAFQAYVVYNFELSKIDLLSLGTANGIFLGAFKDMWQFYHRKG